MMFNRHSITPLSNDAILGRAPSVFAEHAGPGASDKYQFVKTIDVLENMRKSGFEVVHASQSSARTDDGRQYSKHAVRLIHSDYLGKPMQVGGVMPQVVLTNSHNRTSAFHLMAGLYRLACSNGMMTTTAEFSSVRVLHNDPKIYDNIIDGTHLIREVQESVALPMIERMEKKELSEVQAIEFAQAATYLKFGEVRTDHAVELLAARRAEDEGRSVWAVLNRIQENVVRGGYTAKDRANRNIKVRGIESVDKDLEFNVQLWQLGAQVVELV